MSTYGIGGNEVKLDANEAFQEIPQNRTLLVEKLTTDTPVKPDIIGGLKTIDDIFDYFKPEVEVDFEDKDGGSKKETLKFSSLGNFGKKGIINQSNFLLDLTTEQDQFHKIIKALKSNKILKTALANPESKTALLAAIKGLINELDQSEK